jgi:hypothetical protein
MGDAVPIKDMLIQDGDPVTADLLKTMVANIQLIAKGTNSSAINIVNKTDTVEAKVSGTTITKEKVLTVNPKNTPSAKYKWTFGKTFTQTPACWVQARGASLNEPQSRMHIIVTSVDTTSMNFVVRSGAGAAGASVTFDMFATGTLA